MRAVDPAVPIVQSGDENFRDAERLDSRAGADDVGDGVERADLMEMDIFHRLAVDFPLGHGDPLENAERVLLYERRELARGKEFADFAMGAPVDMGVFVPVVFVFMVFVFVVVLAAAAVVVVVVRVGVLGMRMLRVGVVRMLVMGVGVFAMLVRVLMGLMRRRSVPMLALVPMGSPFVNGELRPFNLAPFSPLEVHMEVADLELGKLPLERGRFHAEVAERAGNVKAVRAAGNGLGSNPIPVIVPCHRVVRTGGGLGGYTGGLERKEFLLALERG